MKHALNRLLRKTIGYEIRRPIRTPVDIMRARQIDVVLDVGANVGQYASTIRRQGYDKEIVSFEPVKVCFDILRALSEKDALWETRHTGIGNFDGSARINVSDNIVYSSFYQPSSSVTAFDKRAARDRTEEVRICKLDSIYTYGPRRVYLKIDTQGYEREVLLGVERNLDKISAVQVELGTMQLYEAQPSYIEVCRFMQDSRFSVAQIYSSEHFAADGKLLDMDIVFINDRLSPTSA